MRFGSSNEINRCKSVKAVLEETLLNMDNQPLAIVARAAEESAARKLRQAGARALHPDAEKLPALRLRRELLP